MPQTLFIVDETQAAIVTRFGEPKRQLTSPGLYRKVPFIETVRYFDNRNTLFDAPPDALLTEDKKRLIIDAYAIGRVVGPLAFFETVKNTSGAISAATGIINSDLRSEIANDLQIDVIKENREEIMTQVRDSVVPKIAEFGIELIDVRIKRADFPREIADSIYGRMQAERQRIASAERAEGAKRDLEIRAEVDRKATVIQAEAERDANITRGEGEAEAISIFASALEEDPEFYSFQRSLEAYKEFLVGNTTMVLPADSELFQFLQSPAGLNGIAASSPPAAASNSELLQAEAAARQLLSLKLETDAAAIELTSFQEMDWPDASLGCPQDGQMYAQMIVPGYKLVFQYQGAVHEVNSSSDGSHVVSCKP